MELLKRLLVGVVDGLNVTKVLLSVASVRRSRGAEVLT